MGKVSNFFVIILIFLSTACSFFGSKSEYIVKNYSSIKLDNFDNKKNKIYIKNSICLSELCIKIKEETKKKLLLGGILITENISEANYILKININSISKVDKDTALMAKNYITYTDIAPAFYFDSNNNPHLISESDRPTFQKEKNSFNDNKLLSKKSLFIAGGSSAIGLISFLIAPSSAIISGLSTIIAAGGGYLLYNSLEPNGIIVPIEIEISEKIPIAINKSKKMIRKISDNISEEVFSLEKTNFQHFNSKTIIIAIASRWYNDEINDEISSIASNSIVDIFNLKLK